MSTGILYAVLAYTAWGLFPLYLKQVGFALIWAVLLVYTLEGWWTRRQVVMA